MTTYILRTSHADELTHHGVKGMKWGVRRFQNKDGSLTSAGKRRYGYGGLYRKKSVDKSSNRSHTKTKSQDNNEKHRLTDKQKRAIKIGAAAVGAGLLTYGTYRLAKSGKLDPIVDKGKQRIDNLLRKNGKIVAGDMLTVNSPNVTAAFKKLSKPETIKEARHAVNPGHTGDNCYNCAVAFPLRLCGHDAIAKGAGGKVYFNDVCKVFGVESKSMYNGTVDKLRSYLLKHYSEGDIGGFGFNWNEIYKENVRKRLGEKAAEKVTGHTLNWIIENGKVKLEDSQKDLDSSYIESLLSRYMDGGEVLFAKFLNRFDDVDSEVLERAKKFAKGSNR